MKDRIVGRVPILTGHTPLGATVRDGDVHLAVSTRDGTKQEIVVDHVIAATGYRIDLSRLSFMTDHLRSLLRTEGRAPALSSNFESSVPGLFFVGPASMNSFGPVVRFVYGARFTAQRISKYLARTRVGTYHAAMKRPANTMASEMPVDPDVAAL
jgi:thioredoxin reductase